LKKIFSVLLSLALLVSLGVVATAPVTAATLPSTSPTEATYDLDLPAQLVVGISMGSATGLANITNIGNGTTLGGGDYAQYETIIVLKTSYLSATLPKVGDNVTLQFNFNMPGPYVYSTYLEITATGTDPALSPSSKDWNFYTQGNVTTTILWGIARNVVSIGDETGDIGSGNWSAALYSVSGSGLNISQNYFTGRWPSSTNISSSVVLNVAFDKGNNATLTVDCVGVTTPSLSPATLYFNYNQPANVTSTITWGPATKINKVRDVTYLITPYEIVNPGNYTTGADNKTFTLLYTAYGPSWLNLVTFNYASYYLSAVTYKYLEVEFDDPANTKVNLTLVISPNLPSISPTTAEWNLDITDPTYLYLYTVPTMGDSTNITRIYDQFGYNLSSYPSIGACGVPPYFDYRVAFNPLLGVYVLSVWKCYFLSPNPQSGGVAPLSKPGDSCNLTIVFDKGTTVPIIGYVGPKANFIVTAVGTDASISPNKADFNLDAPANVTTSITWGPWANATTSITVGTDTVSPSFYTVGAYVNATTPSTLNIAADYLDGVLDQPDDTVVLKINFNSGNPATLTITGIGTPSCFIATAAGTDAPQLDILREFRDKVMRPNSLGAELVSLYYKVSPPIAEVISQNDALKALVKSVIDPVVAVLTWSHGLWS